jgi:hypothetical protein
LLKSVFVAIIEDVKANIVKGKVVKRRIAAKSDKLKEPNYLPNSKPLL